MSTSVEIPPPDQARDGLALAPWEFGGWPEQWAREWMASRRGGTGSTTPWPEFRKRAEAALRARLTPTGTFRMADPAQRATPVAAVPQAAVPGEGQRPFESVPLDCLAEIFRALDNTSLRACRMVCREWRDLTSTAAVWADPPRRATITVGSLAELASAVACFPVPVIKVAMTGSAEAMRTEAMPPRAAFCPGVIDADFDDEEAQAHTALGWLACLFPDVKAVRLSVCMDGEGNYCTLEELAAAISGMARLEVLHLAGHVVGRLPWRCEDGYREPKSEAAVVPALQRHPALRVLRLLDGNISGTCLAGIMVSAPHLQCVAMDNSCDFGEWGDGLFKAVEEANTEHRMGASLELFLISGSYQDDRTAAFFNRMVGREVCLAEYTDEPRHYMAQGGGGC